VLGKLGFIGIAQSAGFKLREIQELIAGIDGADGMGEKMRSLPVLKLGEVEALLDRTKAMKGWLEVGTGVWLCDARRVLALPRSWRRASERRTRSAPDPGPGQELSSPHGGLKSPRRSLPA
jgi:hypothetical protein